MNLISVSGKLGSGKDTVGKIIQYLTHTTVKEHNLTYDEFINLGFEEDAFDWKIKKFADKLKDIVCLLIGCTREQLEDREFKETPLGPEWVINRVKIGIKGDKFGIKGFHNTHTLEKIFLSIEEAQDFVNEFYDKSFSREQEQMTPRLMMQLLGTEAGRQIIHPNIWVNSLFSDYKPIRKSIQKSTDVTDNRLKHGYNKTRIFSIYHNIKQRCSNSKHPRYEDYGARGITMCEEWTNSFKSFIKWSEENGYSEELTLDRKDNDLGYYPDNCRWVTYSIQAINTKVRRDNTTGYKGVSYEKKNNNRIRANIQINGKIKFLGYFNTLEEASEAYELAYIEREQLYDQQESNTEEYPNIIITDMRFPNELKAVKDRGGITIRVNRPYEIVDNTIKDGRFTAIPLTDAQMFSETHPSETSLDSAEFDYTIWNNEGIPELIEEVKLILQKEKIII